MLLRSKVWVTVGLLCVSMAARAEYKEVWNPPEAAQKVRHAGHGKPAATGIAKSGNRAKPAPHGKATTKPVALSTAKPKAKATKATKVTKATKATKATHVAAAKTAPVHAQHAEAAAKPRQVAQSNAPQVSGLQPPRELPPILH